MLAEKGVTVPADVGNVLLDLEENAKTTLKVLAFEARVNTLSAGPLRSRVAKAIGFIDMMIDYSTENAHYKKNYEHVEVPAT
ncbi:hypothetical protein Tco_0337098, partial [Tanacetum coccineum]